MKIRMNRKFLLKSATIIMCVLVMLFVSVSAMNPNCTDDSHRMGAGLLCTVSGCTNGVPADGGGGSPATNPNCKDPGHTEMKVPPYNNIIKITCSEPGCTNGVSSGRGSGGAGGGGNVSAESDVDIDASMNRMKSFISVFVVYIGAMVTFWGAVQLGMSYSKDDAGGKEKALKILIAGVMLIGMPALVNVITLQ